MSYISKVLINGLKGITRDYTLSPFTYIHGQNRSNKTSIIDAIQVAILGYHPSLQKTAASTFELCSGQEMDVAVHFSDGNYVRRVYTKNTRGVSASVTPSDYGPDLRLMPCLDHSLYFGKSEKERVQQVINLSQGSEADALVPKVMSALKMIKNKDHKEIDERVLAALLSEMPAHEEGMPIQLWLGSVLDWAKAKAKEERARATKFESSQAIVSEANAIDSLDNAKTIDELRFEISRARADENEEIVLNERAMSEWRAYNEKYTARKEIEAKIKTSPAVEPVDALQREFDLLMQQNKDLDTERSLITTKGQAAMSVHASKTSAMSVHISKKAASLSEIKKLAGLDHCPTCKASSEGWRKHAERYYSAEATEADLKIAELQAEADTAKSQADQLRPRLAQVKDAIGKNNARITELQAVIRRSTEIETNLRRNIVEYNKFGNNYVDQKPQPPAESDALRAARDEVAKIARQIQAIESQEHERRRIEQIAEIGAEARSAAEMSKRIADKIQEKQAEIVEDSFGPILEVANKLSSGVMPSPIAYYDGRVGRYVNPGSIFIPVNAFSGSELKLTQVAITVGLCRQAANKIAIIDEMGVFDEQSRTRITQNAIDLIETGVIDQIIMVGVQPPSNYISDTSTVIAC
jgi:hypothetical protein